MFEEGDVVKELTIDIVDDTDAEPDEIVFVYVTDPSGKIASTLLQSDIYI